MVLLKIYFIFFKIELLGLEVFVYGKFREVLFKYLIVLYIIFWFFWFKGIRCKYFYYRLEIFF